MKIVQRAHHAGWLQPLQSRVGFAIWSHEDVARLEARLAAGEYPPPLPCEVAYRQRVRATKQAATLQPAA